MSDPKLSVHFKFDYRGGKPPRGPFWQHYWQRIVIAVSLAVIWIVAKQF